MILQRVRMSKNGMQRYYWVSKAISHGTGILLEQHSSSWTTLQYNLEKASIQWHMHFITSGTDNLVFLACLAFLYKNDCSTSTGRVYSLANGPDSYQGNNRANHWYGYSTTRPKSTHGTCGCIRNGCSAHAYLRLQVICSSLLWCITNVDDAFHRCHSPMVSSPLVHIVMRETTIAPLVTFPVWRGLMVHEVSNFSPRNLTH